MDKSRGSKQSVVLKENISVAIQFVKGSLKHVSHMPYAHNGEVNASKENEEKRRW